MQNVFITPHTAGETRRYEENVIDILLENLDRLWRGETTLQESGRLIVTPRMRRLIPARLT